MTNHTYTTSDAHNADWHFTIHRTRWQRFLGWLADRGGPFFCGFAVPVAGLFVACSALLIGLGEFWQGVFVLGSAGLVIALVAKDKRTRGEV